MKKTENKSEQGWDKGFDEVKKRHLLHALKLTSAQRLEWLTQMLDLFESIRSKKQEKN